MENRPRLGLQNPTHRARLRGVGIAGIDVKPHPKLPEIRRTIEVPKRPQPTLSAHKIKIGDISPHLPKQTRSRVLKRQITKPVYTVSHKHKPPLRLKLAYFSMIALCIVGLMAVAFRLRTSHIVNAENKRTSNQSGSGELTSEAEGILDETEPQGVSDYRVDPDLPRFFIIDKLGINARIRSVGALQKNILAAPSNIFDVGWYTASTKPGQTGTIVLDGSVAGPTKNGVFYSIGTLKAGDKVGIERGDGKQFQYSVTSMQSFDNDKVDISKLVTSSVPGKNGLNLITGAGRFNVRTNRFEQRIVVYTVQD